MTNLNKKEILNQFFNKYKDLPKQGSKEWLSIKKYTVG